MVELPSKPHSGSCSSVGKELNSLICVLPRRFGVGVYPSSQIYSSLYLVIEPLLSLMLLNVENRSLLGHHTRVPGPRQAVSYQAIKVPIAAVRQPATPGVAAVPVEFLMRHRRAADLRPEQPNGACTAD